MADPPGRDLTLGMAVKVLACVTVVSRTTGGVKWDAADVERMREALGMAGRIQVAAMEVQRVLRVLEGEDPPWP